MATGRWLYINITFVTSLRVWRLSQGSLFSQIRNHSRKHTHPTPPSCPLPPTPYFNDALLPNKLLWCLESIRSNIPLLKTSWLVLWGAEPGDEKPREGRASNFHFYWRQMKEIWARLWSLIWWRERMPRESISEVSEEKHRREDAAFNGYWVSLRRSALWLAGWKRQRSGLRHRLLVKSCLASRTRDQTNQPNGTMERSSNKTNEPCRCWIHPSDGDHKSVWRQKAETFVVFLGKCLNSFFRTNIKHNCSSAAACEGPRRSRLKELLPSYSSFTIQHSPLKRTQVFFKPLLCSEPFPLYQLWWVLSCTKQAFNPIQISGTRVSQQLFPLCESKPLS